MSMMCLTYISVTAALPISIGRHAAGDFVRKTKVVHHTSTWGMDAGRAATGREGGDRERLYNLC